MKKDQNPSVNRRSFLHSAALASGSLVWVSNAVAQTAANSALNVAILGVGAQGQELLNICAKMEGIRIRALCDIWETYNLNRASEILTGFNQEHTRYNDYKAMLEKEKDIQAILIATPDFCHAEQTIACLNAGINVYCESPMSNTHEGARSMVQAARSTGKLLQIGYQRRSNPLYRYSLDHVINETRMLGKVTAVNGQWNRAVQSDRGWPRRAALEDAVLNQYGYASMAQYRNWQWYRALGGGPFAVSGSHQIDVFNWFMNAYPKSVMASGTTAYYDPATHEWYDTMMAIFEYEKEKESIRAFYQTINANSNFGFFENLMGTEGTLYLSEASGRVKVYREPAAPDWEKWVKIGVLESAQPAPKKTPEKPADGTLEVQETVIPPSYNLPVAFKESVYQPHLQNFFNTVRGSEKLNCPAETAYATNFLVLKINEAAQNGQRIELKPEDFQA